jgi:outer membrane protein TolC
VIGASLDDVYELAATPTPSSTSHAIDTLEGEALEQRPDVRLTRIQEQLADASYAASRATFLPQLAAQGAYEWNGRTVGSQVSAWTVGAELRISLFRGLADRARLAELRETRTRRALEREQAEIAARLDVRAALARLEAAHAREATGRASIAGAKESQRIIRNRYEAGMADVTELLRASEAVLSAESMATSALVDALVQAAALERAVGR